MADENGVNLALLAPRFGTGVNVFVVLMGFVANFGHDPAGAPRPSPYACRCRPQCVSTRPDVRRRGERWMTQVAMYTMLVGIALMPLELPVALERCWYDPSTVAPDHLQHHTPEAATAEATSTFSGCELCHHDPDSHDGTPVSPHPPPEPHACTPPWLGPLAGAAARDTTRHRPPAHSSLRKPHVCSARSLWGRWGCLGAFSEGRSLTRHQPPSTGRRLCTY
jgi:hypothetical protein